MCNYSRFGLMMANLTQIITQLSSLNISSTLRWKRAMTWDLEEKYFIFSTSLLSDKISLSVSVHCVQCGMANYSNWDSKVMNVKLSSHNKMLSRYKQLWINNHFITCLLKRSAAICYNFMHKWELPTYKYMIHRSSSSLHHFGNAFVFEI